jgi:hypothetical protein
MRRVWVAYEHAVICSASAGAWSGSRSNVMELQQIVGFKLLDMIKGLDAVQAPSPDLSQLDVYPMSWSTELPKVVFMDRVQLGTCS